MTAAAPVFGVLAALVGIADAIPYVRDTLGRSTPAAPGNVAHLGRPGPRRAVNGAIALLIHHRRLVLRRTPVLTAA